MAINLPSNLQSRQFKLIIGIIGALIIILAAFKLGVFVGMRKANFSFRWGENYHRNFGGPRGGFMQEFEGRDFISGHGTVGTVMKIDGNSLIIKDQDGVEKTVVTSDKTTISRGRETLQPKDLAADSQVVIIGSPKDDGTIEAEFIRLFPPPRQAGSGLKDLNPLPFPKF